MMNYELSFLISPDLSDSEVNSLIQKIASLLGEVTHKDEPKRIRLAYTIDNKSEAFLGVLQFTTEKISDIKKELDKEKDILRFLIVKVEQEKPKKKRVKKEPTEKTPTIEPKEKKVDLKNIEENLDKVLE